MKRKNDINRWWKNRAKKNSHITPAIFYSADELWKACCQYFEWAENNPLYEQKVCQFRENTWRENIPKVRAFTQYGLCTYLGIVTETWANWRHNDMFKFVCAMVDQIIYTQKFENASADLLNANIIARDLGLRDGTELTGLGGSPIEVKSKSDVKKLSDAELRELVTLIDKAKK